jgi:uncharacterized protein (DUF433 family)
MKPLTVHDMSVPLHTDADGVVRLGATRVTLDTVIRTYREGCTAEEIVEQFPTLSLADVHGTIAYSLVYATEVDEYMRVRQAEAENLQRQVWAVSNQHAMRERLLNRQASRQSGT